MTGYFGLEDVPESPAQLDTTIGARWSGRPYEATRELIDAYARVTGYPRDLVERAGGAASPVFSAVASMTSHAGLLVRIVPHDLLWRSVHLSQSMSFHGLIRPGDVVTSSAELVEVRAAPLGCSITMAVEMNVGSTMITEARHRVLLRGVRVGTSSSAAAPPAARPGDLTPLGARVYELDEDHSIAYSEVSRDFLPIHTDRNVAIMAGFTGLILHGLCTFAMCVHAAIEVAGDRDPLTVASMSATFTRPVLCGIPLGVEVSAEGERGLRFIAEQSGKRVLRDAVAQRR